MIVSAKVAQFCTNMQAHLSDIFVCGRRLTGFAVAAVQQKVSRAFLWLGSACRIAPLARWQQRLTIQSALDHKDKSARQTTKRAKDDSTKPRRRAKKPKPEPDKCTWLCLDQPAQGSVLPVLRCEGPLNCTDMVDQVEPIEYRMVTTKPAQSHIRLKYLVKNLQTGEQRPVEHRVELALFAGRWWFVDEGRCCDELCLPPGGDRFRHREAHGVKSSVQRNASAKPVNRPPRGASVARRGPETAEQGLAGQVKKAAKRVTGIWKYAVSRTAIPSLMRSFIGQFAWLRATLLAFWNRAAASTLAVPS